jgi:hypothetical protein
LQSAQLRFTLPCEHLFFLFRICRGRPPHPATARTALLARERKRPSRKLRLF